MTGDEPTATSVFVCAPDPDPACASTTSSTTEASTVPTIARLPRTGIGEDLALVSVALTLVVLGYALIKAARRRARWDNYPTAVGGPAVRRCETCGCTDERACPGGCAWLPGLADVCTACGPPIPRNVKLIHPNGREEPLDCRYAGVDDTGIHVWEAILPEPVDLDGLHLYVELLPAHTAVRVPVA